MSLSYGWEKLHQAVHTLTGAATQKERLVSAIVHSLVHIRPEENLPPEMRDEFVEFINSMTAVAAKADEGSVQATVDTLGELEVHNAFDKIIGFYDTICRHREPH